MTSFQVQTNDLDTIRKELRQTKERSEIDKHNTTITSPRNDHHNHHHNQPQQQTKTLKILSTTSPPAKKVKVDHKNIQRNQNWVVLKGLPNTVCAQDVSTFFKGLTILNIYAYY